MSYQALLFCPDEKIASTVTQVLSELEFTVVPCAEPFAAVKRLMAERFDAVVVDCDNEQNAALLFKSARGSASNQTALAVAVVEGQAGVAKAFRLGANLVLTKPVNIEQAKGTLRVARGLLKKNEIARSAAAAVAAQQPGPDPAASFMPGIAFESVAPTPTRPPAQRTPTLATTAKRPASIARADAPIHVPAPRPAAPASMGSAAATAPARETKISGEKSLTSKPALAIAESQIDKSQITESQIANSQIAEPAIEDTPSATVEASQSADADSSSAAPYAFTFGGANPKPASEASSGGSKKILGVVAALVALGAAAYYGWTTLYPSGFASSGHSAAAPAVASPVVTAPVKAPPAATLPAPAAAQPAVAVAPTLDNAGNNPAVSAIDAETSEAPKANAAGTATKSAPASAPASKSPASPAAPSIKVGRTSTVSLKKSEAEVAAPGVVAMSSPDASALPGISPSQPVLPKPVLQTVNISQGVSQGLIVKRVQPHYPQSAVQQRIEGDVNLVATISKNGDITAVKVTSGQSVLVHAAVEAVRQWKYKPYLLNGEPVEIQTDVTVKFKLPK